MMLKDGLHAESPLRDRVSGLDSYVGSSARTSVDMEQDNMAVHKRPRQQERVHQRREPGLRVKPGEGH
jgi:hypothetical protein